MAGVEQWDGVGGGGINSLIKPYEMKQHSIVAPEALSIIKVHLQYSAQSAFL